MAAAEAILFHPATSADIPVIQDLSSRIWREHYPGIITHAQIDYMLERMYARDVIIDEIANKGYRYIVVTHGSAPIGYVAYRHEEGGAVLLSKLYLVPSHHGRGIGARTLQYVCDDALRNGARMVYLFVNKNNGKAIKAYERFGFVKAREVVTDIGGGFVMDDFRMELLLHER